jgi:hypothetical protein
MQREGDAGPAPKVEIVRGADGGAGAWNDPHNRESSKLIPFLISRRPELTHPFFRCPTLVLAREERSNLVFAIIDGQMSRNHLGFCANNQDKRGTVFHINFVVLLLHKQDSFIRNCTTCQFPLIAYYLSNTPS